LKLIVAREASLGPLRSLGDDIISVPADRIRPISLDDFKMALNVIRPSVSQNSLQIFENWNKTMGMSGL